MYICCQLYILHLKREWKILKFRNLRSLCGPSISFTKVMMICIQVFSRLLDLAIFVYNLGHIKQEKWTSLKGNYTWYPNDNDNNNKVMKSVNGFTLGLSHAIMLWKRPIMLSKNQAYYTQNYAHKIKADCFIRIF